MNIYEAAKIGDSERIRRIIVDGASIDSLDEYGTPAIYYATWHGKLDVLRILLESGADVNQPIDMNLGWKYGRYDWTALHAAAEQNDVKSATILLDYDANIDVTTQSGRTPLRNMDMKLILILSDQRCRLARRPTPVNPTRLPHPAR